MLTDILWVIINNSFKKSFYGKRKKKVTNILTTFSIFYKRDLKTFLK